MAARAQAAARASRATTAHTAALTRASARAAPRMSAAQRRARVADIARKQLGDWYQHGAAGPSRFDCSGLAMWAFRFDRRLPHKAARQSGMGRPISRAAVREGDLVYFGGRGTAYHVGVVTYHGRYGIRIVDAPGAGRKVQKRQPWSGARYARLIG